MNYRNKLSYSRINAVNYARTYAGSPNTAYRYFPVQGDNGGDCTNFISQCLRAGGSPMVFSGKTRWWYTGQSWSVSWAVASSLYWYLKINSAEKLYGVKGMQVNST
ncbi:MAG TPA: methylase, partial [Clostridium sp.]|nr:methylase [Clostridium sp.]